jgi:hypothetical protein
MPNWCDNSMRVSHSDKSKVDALEAVLQSDDKGVFQHLLPMPESEQDNWYDWNINNWGTKWECSIIDWERCDDNSIWISFESAWSPPIALYEHIYHELDWQVEGLYHEGGCAFCGIWKDGDDDFYEYNFDELETLEALPGDLQDFTGLIDYYHDQQQDRIAEEEFQKEEETKTEWFDPTVKPVRVGSYEAKDPEHPNWPFAEFATWDGKKWINGDGKKIKIAKWRGLKEDPNGS